MQKPFIEYCKDELDRSSKNNSEPVYQDGKTKGELILEFSKYRKLLDSTAINRYSNTNMSLGRLWG
jgi:hypothetical protein